MSITFKQKKFLVVWTTVNIFALFVNLAPMRGEFETVEFGTWYLWTSTRSSSDFWPFTTFLKHVPSYWNYDLNMGRKSYYEFMGIFNSYGIAEFTGYLILGFGIIFIPKFLQTKEIPK